MAGQRGTGNRFLTRPLSPSLLGVLLVSCAGAPTIDSKQEVLYSQEVVGFWVRPMRGTSSGGQEGLDIRAEGVFHLIGIHSMDGLTWRLNGDILRLATATERYPEPFVLNHRIELLDETLLVLAPGSYLGGRYTRSTDSPPTLSPRRRAVAVDANRDRYCRVTRRLPSGDSSALYSAYYFEADPYRMSLRLIDEEIGMADHTVQRSRYFFDDQRLYFYRAEKRPAAGEPDGDEDRVQLTVSYDREGEPTQVLRVSNGAPVAPRGDELERIAGRVAQLFADLRRTSECRRTAQEQRRAKRIKRLRERLRPGRGVGGH